MGFLDLFKAWFDSETIVGKFFLIVLLPFIWASFIVVQMRGDHE